MNNKYYLALRDCPIDEVTFKGNVLLRDILQGYIEVFGDDFIGLYDDPVEAQCDVFEDMIKRVELTGDIYYRTINHLEICLGMVMPNE